VHDWLAADTGLLPHPERAQARLDAGLLDRLAALLDLKPSDTASTVRSLARLHGCDLPAFEIRTTTWKIDLPTALLKSVLTGTITATLLQSLGADALPVAVLSFVAPLLLEIRRVEVQPSDVLIQAELSLTAADKAQHLQDLYDLLPTGMRAELSFAEFADVAERLLQARLAVAGPGGLRVYPPGARRGFRLIVTEPRLPVAATPSGGARSATSPDEGGAVTAAATSFRHARGERPRVFVSYAHDSAAHKERVLRFCEFLVASGVDVRMDRWDLGDRRDWQLWATSQICDSDFVIVIASPICKQVGDGTIAQYSHAGLQSEMRLLRELYHSDPVTWTRKILPVMLPGHAVDEIPLFLQPHTADHFVVSGMSEEGAEDLLRVLTGQPPYLPPAPGPRQELPPCR
jgi:SEFIR domain